MKTDDDIILYQVPRKAIKEILQISESVVEALDALALFEVTDTGTLKWETTQTIQEIRLALADHQRSQFAQDAKFAARYSTPRSMQDVSDRKNRVIPLFRK